jgi:hypothetical protein
MSASRCTEAAQVYLGDTFASEGAEALEYILDYFHTLVEFYAGAAARKDAVILYIA